MTQYQIHIQGHLDQHWETVFSGFQIHHAYNPDGEPITVMRGDVIDQAALYGIINRLRNLGMELISAQPNPEQQ